MANGMVEQNALVRDLERTCLAIEHAAGLPNNCYTDLSHFEAEKRQLFDRGWVCIGFGKDVPQSGDALPVDHFGVPLLVLRDKNGDVRVLHNVCSHRGMVLVNEAKRIGSVIRCPYHSWCYGLDGGLKATPHVGGAGRNAHPAVDRQTLGLRAVRSAVWFDMIFVNLSGDAPAFDQFIGPLAERWQMFDQKEFCHAGPEGSLRIDVACNWKLAVENYCESYHLPWVHPGLNSYSRLEDHDNIVEPGVFSGQGTRVYAPRLSSDGRRLPDFPSLARAPGTVADIWRTRGEYVALYPNVLLGVHRDHVFTIRLEALGPERTIEHLELYVADGSDRSEEAADLRRTLQTMWQEVFEEDIAVVEGMQRGRASPAFHGGVFSPVMDEATHAFHRWVADRLLAGSDNEYRDDGRTDSLPSTLPFAEVV